MSRVIKLDDEQLDKILRERKIEFDKSVEVNKEIVKLDEARTKIAYKLQRLKDKTVPIIDKYKDTINLNEFEVITSVRLNQEKFPEVEIIDQLEEFTRPKTDEEIAEFKKMLKEKEENIKKVQPTSI